MFTKTYYNKIQQIKVCLKDADAIIVGAGAGMSASCGLDYTSPILVQKWFPSYYKMGFRRIIDIQSIFWDISEQNAAYYWGYWANHIYHIRYEAEPGKAYTDLFSFLKEKNYFIITTNVDGQFEKAGFTKEKIFAPQGDYRFFQCQNACTEEIYENKKMIQDMLKNMDKTTMKIQEEDIPYCPHCGSLLVPNLRKDGLFVEKSHLSNLEAYQSFISLSLEKKLVLLELGVGFNTPIIIRFPFEEITKKSASCTLIRINNSYPTVSAEIEQKSISLKEDISKCIENMVC